MKPMRPLLLALLSLAVPFWLILTAIRLLFTPAFLNVEYRLPGFPADPYGFTLQDRLHYGSLSLEYLVNDSDLTFLEEITLADGSPLYNARELSHMLDVKILVQQAFTVGWVLTGVLLGVGVWAWRARRLASYGSALSRGGIWTLGLVGAILLAVVLSFNALFTLFHRLFFTGDTWLFLYSDSLIRLFPMRFWQDAFIAMGLFTVLGALLLALFARKLR